MTPTFAVTSKPLSTSSGAIPAPFQLDASGFIFERNASMLLAGVGTGKTLTYLMTMQDWIADGVIPRCMLVAPLRVVNQVWRQEARKWQSSLTFSLCTGELSAREQREAVEANTDILLVNNAMLPKVLEHGGHRCRGLVIDELSKYRDATGKWAKAIRSGPFDVRSGGTGTPAPNGYLSLYGMAHAVGLGRLVGRNFDKWKRTYFYPTDYLQHNWAPLPGTLEALTALIRPHTYVLEESTVDLPPVTKIPVYVELPPDLRASYVEMRNTLGLSEVDIVAVNNGVARNKLRQIASGFAYDNGGDAVRLAPWRLDALQDLVDEMQGAPLIIAYEFREQKEMMLERWPRMRFLGGGTAAGDDERTIEDWAAGKIPLLGMHPASAGHGLNDLDLGGSTIAWWQPHDDLELDQQLIGRLTRRGQKAARVRVLYLVARDTTDEGVFSRLAEKDVGQEALWGALRAPK